MGRLILCCGEKAKEGWYVKETDTRLYSIEEVCYYIYNNIYIMAESFFSSAFADWVEEELKLSVLAEKLRKLILNKNGLKDRVVTVLCSADYYTESEIKELLVTIDQLDKLSGMQREKHRADLWLKKERYGLAASAYRKILAKEKENDLSLEEVGAIYHNLGIACLHTDTVEIAAKHFREAYGRNRKEESLKAYVQACQMAHIELTELSREQIESLLEEYTAVEATVKEKEDYKRIYEAQEKRMQGQRIKYYEQIDKLLEEWKQDYRRKVG